MTTSSSKS